MRRNITISFALLMILFSTAIPGVYAMEGEPGMELPEMDADQMKEMTLEMIGNSIDTLTTLRSEIEGEELLDSVDNLLEQMESLQTDLEATYEEDEIAEIMDEFRTSMDDAPDEIREALMKNGPGGEGKGPMEGEPPEGYIPGNENMDGESPMDKPDHTDTDNDMGSSGSTSEESSGFFSSLINAIRSLF